MDLVRIFTSLVCILKRGPCSLHVVNLMSQNYLKFGTKIGFNEHINLRKFDLKISPGDGVSHPP